ncbi:MAG TPA: dihydrolipoyllysine-residue acetyltransferase [Woeseiaceae bacterium]|nr:dihydrolipoyllysine-residue acetyltransferase [Woeseiaceae bacterium]
MANSIDIVVPDLGDFSDVEVIEVLVGEGDRVAREDGLITLETDKASMDVPSPEDGVIESLSVSAGDRINSGDVIGKMSVEGDGGEKQPEDDSSSGEQDEDNGQDEQAKQAEQAEQAGETSGERTLKVPDIGDFEDVDVIEVHVEEGQEISAEDPLITLETDKASMDVPAEVGGKIKSVQVSVGDKVSRGSSIVVIEAAGDAGSKPAKSERAEKPKADAKTSAPAKAPARPEKQAASSKSGKLPPINEAGFARAHASPSVRKLARELGVDLVQVKGSGAKNRVLHDDVKAFVKAILSGQAAAPAGAGLPQVPKVDFAKFGEIELQKLTRIQKISGPRLQASWVNLPHVTQHDLADITELEDRRQKLKGAAKEKGIPLTPLAFILKACVAALKEFPKVNASLSDDGENLVLKKYCHLGFAADTDQGLVVPVIRDADQKDVYELAKELGELSLAAREGKLKAEQMQGATFTISSLGGIGGTAFTPIVNAPEVAILGVSRHSMQPVWDGEQFVPRLMLPLSFSYDHRVIDGAMAVRFTTRLGEALADVDALLQAIP